MSTSNWEFFKIGDLVKQGQAEIQTGPFGTQLKASDYIDDGIPVINVRNIGFTNIRSENLEYIGQDTVNRLANHVLEEGDIVFARKGAVERHAFITAKHSGWLQGSDCIRLRIYAKSVKAQFISYLFLTNNHQEWMKNQGSHGATMATLNQSIIAQIKVTLPPLATQQRIVDILSNYDRAIDNNNRRIELLEESIHKLYKEWFVRLRFPGYESVKVVDGIPEGWRNSTISDAFTIIGGGTPSKNIQEYWQDGTITWYSPTDLTKANTMFMEKSGSQITSVGLANSSARLFPPFSVMMTSRATIGVVSINTTEACTNQGFITCIPNEKIPLYFLYCWIKANTEIFYNLASGATFKEISKGIFKKIPIIIPDAAIINKFEDKAKAYGSLILILQKENQYLYESRDLLLPRLMNGSIAV